MQQTVPPPTPVPHARPTSPLASTIVPAYSVTQIIVEQVHRGARYAPWEPRREGVDLDTTATSAALLAKESEV